MAYCNACWIGSAPFCRRCARVSPFEIFHDQEIDVVLMTDVEERADVGVIQAGDGLRFPVEALAQHGAVGGRQG